MSKITSNLYIGGIDDALSKRFLVDNRITHIVNCSSELPNYYPKDFTYLNLDLNDVESENIQRILPKTYEFILNAIGQGGTVFVHCYAGISRSASVCLYFIMKISSRSYKESFRILRKQRPIVCPNRSFRRQLRGVSR